MPKKTERQIILTANALGALSYSFGQLLAELEIAGADPELLRLSKAQQESALETALKAADSING
ncbi:MAG: hypothetical protein ACN2B6_11950 [Rickettsiales bacterium]